MKSALLKMLKLYQSWSSSRPQRCRYIPTCSHYASQAIEQHGATRGTWFAFKRVCRCNPLGSHGVDLVPEK